MAMEIVATAGTRDRRAAHRPRPIDFETLLGRAAWTRLPAAVQARFAVHRTAATTLYRGRMEVRASLAGRLIAWLCRLIGTPLAPWTGDQVPVEVAVYLERGALVWDRTYRFAGRAPVLVSSRKMVDADGGLLEVVRGGLGMALTVTEEAGVLHFRSRFYFLTLGPVRLPIPGLMTPGAAHVVHQDLGGGRFRFSLAFEHPWLGETMFQEGVFADPA
ncbi:MAG: DUF4166 domain-containing protein [Caulobacter sp.]|nr:DUF4166 domain-containing protein [Caulobacter sp.]